MWWCHQYLNVFLLMSYGGIRIWSQNQDIDFQQRNWSLRVSHDGLTPPPPPFGLHPPMAHPTRGMRIAKQINGGRSCCGDRWQAVASRPCSHRSLDHIVHVRRRVQDLSFLASEDVKQMYSVLTASYRISCVCRFHPNRRAVLKHPLSMRDKIIVMYDDFFF